MTMKFVRNAVLVVFLLLGATLHCIQGFQQAVPPSTRLSYRPLLTIPNHKQNTRSSSHTRTTDTSTSLQATPSLLGAIGSPLGSVSVLAFVVLFHEAGHYLAARSLGIRVEEFSVGIGPKLFGFEKFGNEFSLRGLPLGGYVRFPENYNVTQVQELQEAAMNAQIQEEEKDNDRKKENKALSGLINVLTLGRLERKRAEEEQQAKRQAEQDAEAARSKWWNNIFSSNDNNKNNESPQQQDPTNFEIDYYDDPDLLQNRSWPQRALVLSGGVIFNLLLAFMIFFGEINVGSGLPKPVFEQGAVVTALARQESPAKGILEPGDVIVKVNGSPLSMTQSPNSAAAQRAIGDFIARIRDTPDGDSLNLEVLKKDKSVDVIVQPQRVSDNGPQSIGVMLRPNFKNTVALKSDSIPQAAKMAATSVVELTQETTNGLLSFFSQLASGKGAPAGQSVSGPIGLIRTGSSVVSTNDATAVLLFMAAISVNLAVVNSLPLPALDGGQMLFVISEALTGRKVDQRVQEGITSVALVFLLLLSFSTTIGDVESIFRSR